MWSFINYNSYTFFLHNLNLVLKKEDILKLSADCLSDFLLDSSPLHFWLYIHEDYSQAIWAITVSPIKTMDSNLLITLQCTSTK